MIERVLGGTLSIRSVLLSPSKYERLAPLLEGLSAPVYVAERVVMEQVVGFDVHRGVLAAVDRPPRLEVEGLIGLRSVAVLEGINDHENLGAIFRAAAALGVDGLNHDHAGLAVPGDQVPHPERIVEGSPGEQMRVGCRLTAFDETPHLEPVVCRNQE